MKVAKAYASGRNRECPSAPSHPCGKATYGGGRIRRKRRGGLFTQFRMISTTSSLLSSFIFFIAGPVHLMLVG